MASLGRVCQLIVTNNATFDGSVYVFKHAGTYYLLGTIRAGERKVFPINVVQSGINNGDDIRARVLSNQGADHTDTNIVTYVSNSASQAEYVITGTAGNPNICHRSVNNIGCGQIPPPPCDRRVSRVVVTNNATFDGAVYVFKNAGTYYQLGAIRVGETKTFWINQIQQGINNGDDIRARILSSQGADHTDDTLVTYVANANNEARYTIEGTASDPKMRFAFVAGIV